MLLVVHLYLPLRCRRVVEVSSGWILWEGHIPRNYTYLKKSHIGQLLIDSKDLYIYGSVMTNKILQKIASILNVHVNMPPSWICLPLFNKLFPSFMCTTAQYKLAILMPHTLRKKSYIKRHCSVYRLYHLYSKTCFLA